MGTAITTEASLVDLGDGIMDLALEALPGLRGTDSKAVDTR